MRLSPRMPQLVDDLLDDAKPEQRFTGTPSPGGRPQAGKGHERASAAQGSLAEDEIEPGPVTVLIHERDDILPAAGFLGAHLPEDFLAAVLPTGGIVGFG